MSVRYTSCGHDDVGRLALGPPAIHEPLGGLCPVCKQLRGQRLTDEELVVHDRQYRRPVKAYPWQR